MLQLGNLRHFATGKKIFIQIIGRTIVGITDHPVTDNWINCNNNLALPGLIDTHVHDRKGQLMKEIAITLETSALLGGVTTFAKMPNTEIPATTAEIIAGRAEEDKVLRITTKFWLGATLDNIFEIIQVTKYLRGIVIGVKIYMGSSTGNLLVTDPDVLRRIFQTCADLGLMVGVHAEDEAMMQANMARYGEKVIIADHCVIRSTEVEVSAVKLALLLQRQTGCKLYFCHTSTPEALELIKTAKDAGRTVYAEVCPHHLYLEADLLKGWDGGLYKMNPPLRTWEQIFRLRHYACTPDWVDVIATDHAPHHYTLEKIGQLYKNTASGVPGIQTMLPLMFNFVRWGQMSIQHFVDLTSANAARIFGLEGKGRLEVGADADITIINDTEIRQLRNEDMATLWHWTPFHGILACGFPSHVVAQGKLHYPMKLLVA